MKTIIAISIISMFCFSCTPQDVQEKKVEENKTNKNTLIPKDEYVNLPDECRKKIMNFKLLEQVSVKNYLYKNEIITEDQLTQNVIFYFEEHPSPEQINQLESESVQCNWELWTPPQSNHPLGFVTAKLPIKHFEKVLCFDFVKKMDTAEREISPNYLEKLNSLDQK